MERLVEYFTAGIEKRTGPRSVGIEIETSFVNRGGRPITVAQSQSLFARLRERPRSGWTVRQMRGELVTELADPAGNRILYELGRQNIELAGAPAEPAHAVAAARCVLDELYEEAGRIGAFPRFEPLLETEEDLLVIPDERDATWLALDGRPALELLARTSAVQFTVAVPPNDAMRHLNTLGRNIGTFLRDYPQDSVWKRYIAESRAGYDPLRYGGPIIFKDIRDYCAQLSRHDVVTGLRLVPYAVTHNLDIPLFIRSIWWYFRLKRYGHTLCIEVRPLARRKDDTLSEQLGMVLDLLT